MKRLGILLLPPGRDASPSQGLIPQHYDRWYLFIHLGEESRGTKRLVSVNICSVEGNSVGVFDSKVTPRILVVKEK